MRVAVVHNRRNPAGTGVINVFGPQNRETYNPRTVELVARALEHGGHTVRVIDGNMDVIEALKDFMPRVMAGERPGMVFNMAYGIQGVSRYTHLPAMLEMLGVPYVGSGPMAHGLALDKVIAKIMFTNNGLPTPGFWNFASPDDHFEDLVFPVIVKPKMEAGSYGIRVVDNWDDLREAVATIVNEFQQHVLVEQFVSGREFTIGLLGNGDPEVLPITEIDLRGDPDAIQMSEEELRNPLDKLCPAPLSDELRGELEQLSRRAFQALDLKDFARVDLRMDAKERPYILEINSMANLGRTGTYVHSAQVAGYTYESLINKMLDVAAVRYFGLDYEESARASEAMRSGRGGESASARIRTYLRGETTTTEDALQRLVNVPTPTDEVEAIEGLGTWLAGQFRQIGFSGRDIPRVNVANVRYWKNHDGDTNDLLLLAHLDTASDEPAVRYRVEGNRIYGTGVAECKGGIVVALAALRALRFARRLRRLRVGVLLTSDGMRSGAAARQLIEDAARESRHVLGLKAADLDGSIVTSRSGRSTYRLEVAPRRGARRQPAPHDVITYFCRRVLALLALENPEGGIRVGITSMDVDAAFGSLPERAQVGVTVRFNDPEASAAVDGEVRRIARERSVPGLQLAVSGGERRPPRQSDADQPLYERAAGIARRLNLRIGAVHRWSSADVGFVPADVPALDGLGPIGSGERTADEYVLRSSLVERAVLLANLMLECGGTR